MRIKVISILLLLCFSVCLGQVPKIQKELSADGILVRVEKREALNQTIDYLILEQDGSQRFSVALPYEMVGLETLETLLDGYIFYGFFRFSEKGDPFPFSLRTNSYGTPIRYTYGDICFLPVYPLHTMKEIGTELVKFEWQALNSGILQDFSLWLGKEEETLSRIETNIKRPIFELDAEKYRLDGLYYWKIEGVTSTGAKIESPLFSFRYKPSALAIARMTAEDLQYPKIIENIQTILSALASHTTVLSNAISRSETALSTKIDGLDTNLNAQREGYNALLNQFLSKAEELSDGLKKIETLTGIPETARTDIETVLTKLASITGILFFFMREILGNLRDDPANSVEMIYEAAKYLSESQKESILDSILRYSADTETTPNASVISVFYDLLCTLSPLKQLAIMDRFVFGNEEKNASWLFTHPESIGQFSRYLSFLAGLFSNEFPFCFDPYRLSLRELKQFYLKNVINLENRSIVDPIEVYRLSDSSGSFDRTCQFFEFSGINSGLEYRKIESFDSNKITDTVKDICYTLADPYGPLISMSYLVSVYSAEKRAKGKFEDFFKETSIAKLDDTYKEKVEQLFDFGSVFGYTFGWWGLVRADTWINLYLRGSLVPLPIPGLNLKDKVVSELKKPYNAFKALFTKATPTAIANTTVTLIGTPTGKEATETYVLHEDLTVEAAYGFLKTIEYIYDIGKNSDFPDISSYRDALIQYLYQKGGFKTEGDFIKYLEKYAFETPVKVTEDYIKSIISETISNVEGKKAR